MQAVENRTVAFSLPRPIIKNATAQFSRLLQFFKGAPLRGAFFRACMRGDRVQGYTVPGGSRPSLHRPEFVTAASVRRAQRPGVR